jgi:hypothetical protein
MPLELPPPGPPPPELPPPAGSSVASPDFPGLTPDIDAGSVDITRPPGQPLTGVLDQTVERPDVTRPPTVTSEGHENDTGLSTDGHEPHADLAEDPSRPDAGSEDVPIDDMPPPDVPGFGETGFEEPDRGAALKKVFEILEKSPETAEEAVTAAVQAHSEAASRTTELMVEGALPFVDAAKQAARETYVGEGDDAINLVETALESAIDEATETSREVLDAAGLTLREGAMAFEAEMTDPGAFTEALAQTDAPATRAERDRLNVHIEGIVQDALGGASLVGTTLWSGQAATMVAEADSPEAASIRSSIGNAERVPDDSIHLYDAMVRHSGAMAAETTRLQVPENITEGLRQHAIAANEGLDVEWAVGYQLELVGRGEGSVGVDRLYTPDQWNAAFRYLGYLQLTAPTAQFTQEVGRTVERDIVRALENPDINYLDQPESYAGRSARIRETRPILEHALQEVRRIFRHS